MERSRIEEIVARLAERTSWRYGGEASDSAEPTALAALALLAWDLSDAAGAPLERLAELQSADGSVAFRESMIDPEWSGSLAALAWIASEDDRFASRIAPACEWLLAHPGEPIERHHDIGHDSELPAWSWVRKTSPWLEPTAFHVLALKAAGYVDRPLVRTGVATLFDRLLPSGGANVGNTTVFGAELRPHLQPSGIALLALAGETRFSPRVARTRTYLAQSLSPTTATASLSWGLLGLAAHDDPRVDRDALLNEHLARLDVAALSEHRLALLALAGRAERLPFHPQGRVSVTQGVPS